MRCTLLCAAIVIIAAPALAGPEILPISGINYLTYNEATGEISPTSGRERYGRTIWAAWQHSGYFWGTELGEVGLDWGDIAGSEALCGFVFTEFTNSQSADGDAWAYIMIYAEENGWNSAGRVAIVGYLIDNIPTSTHPPDEYWGYNWRVTIESLFLIDGSDLDSDGLVDFGYAQWFVWPTPGALMGPAIAGDPNADPLTAPGIEDAYDLFIDPNLFSDPNLVDGSYSGTYNFDGDPFAQFYFELIAPLSPFPGDSGRYCTADIAGPYDCIVGLDDLAKLLSNYGMTTGATRLDGDVDPYDEWNMGDDDVDLADLAELLYQYGDDCNSPW